MKDLKEEINSVIDRAQSAAREEFYDTIRPEIIKEMKRLGITSIEQCNTYFFYTLKNSKKALIESKFEDLSIEYEKFSLWINTIQGRLNHLIDIEIEL